MTILDTLKSINAYPIPQKTIGEIAVRRSLRLDTEATLGVFTTNDYKLARADVMRWLASAPNVSQGGQSYSLSDEQRADLKRQANAIYDECEEESGRRRSLYGYKGSKL